MMNKKPCFERTILRPALAVLVVGSVQLHADLWTPAEMTTQLWLDAADVATLTRNGTDDVSQWDDKSGNGLHLAQGSAASQPKYFASGFDGGSMPRVQFTSPPNTGNTGDSLFRNISLSANSWTVFAVIDDQSNDGENWLLTTTGFAGANSKENRWQLGNGGGSVRVRSDSGNGGSANGSFVAGAQQFSYELSVASRVLRNGTEIAGVGSGTYIDTTIDGNFVLGARGVNGHAGMNGDMAEFIYLAGVPTTTDRALVEGYLAWKWGLAGDLPGGHTYKNAAPTTIPEPATFALVILGSLSLILRRWRCA